MLSGDGGVNSTVECGWFFREEGFILPIPEGKNFEWGNFARSVGSELTKSAARQAISIAVNKSGKMNWEQVAADGFGNAIGNAIVDQAKYNASIEREVKARMEAALAGALRNPNAVRINDQGQQVGGPRQIGPEEAEGLELIDVGGEKTKKLPTHFVVHSTDGLVSNDKIEGWRDAGIRTQGHAYIQPDGEIVELWPVTERNVRATRTEWSENNPESRGNMIHVELVTPRGGTPTDAQYDALAQYYIGASSEIGDDLTIVPHKEIDRGIPGAHSDPENFDFNKFYGVLSDMGVEIDTIPKITQERYLYPNQADQVHNWPPQLVGKPARTRK